MTSRITRRRWTSAEDQYVRDHYDREPAEKIAAELGRSADSIWIRAKLLGIGKREEFHAVWTSADLEDVRRNYGTESPASIAKRLGRTTSAVSQQAKVLGVVSRKALVTAATVHDYFSKVASAEQAYILGLLAADGNIATGYPRIQLGLQAKDAHLVEWVRDRLNPKMALSVRPADGHAVLLITSAQMVADLAEHGIVPRKSMTLAWPSHLGALQRPFLCGYFDGDGSACLAREKYPIWSVCSGSDRFLADMKACVLESTGVVMQKIQHRPLADLYQVAVSGRGALVVDQWVHGDGFGLARKRFSEHIAARYLTA